MALRIVDADFPHAFATANRALLDDDGQLRHLCRGDGDPGSPTRWLHHCDRRNQYTSMQSSSC